MRHAHVFTRCASLVRCASFVRCVLLARHTGPRYTGLVTARIVAVIIALFAPAAALAGAASETTAVSPAVSTAVSTAGATVARDAGAGRVELPRAVYDRLIDAARPGGKEPRPVPAAFALGNADLRLDARARGDGTASAQVDASMVVEVLDSDWVLVPLLPAGTPVAEVKIDGQAVQLLPSPLGLAWATRIPGVHKVALSYRVDARSTKHGQTLAVPTPAAPSIRLTALLPGPDLDATLVPAVGVESEQRGGRTEIRATVPTTQVFQLVWRIPGGETHATSRARYKGTVAGDTVTFEGSLDVEVFAEGVVELDLLPRQVTLREVSVDGEASSIRVRGDRFATLVRGRGKHQVRFSFLVPVERGTGPPRATVALAAVPVSRFDLILPGRKDVTSEPRASVETHFVRDSTTATIFAPMRTQMVFRWTEAVPENVRTEVRANAGIYHAAWAEEGVLFMRALVQITVSRGESRALRLRVPEAVQVEQVREIATAGAPGVIADWRMGKSSKGGRELTVYLNRPLSGALILAIDYDRSLPQDAPFALPLLEALGVQRQRGMVALLKGHELTLEPALAPAPALPDKQLTRVGENQLPAFVREQLDLPVAHTFKYVEPPILPVASAVPERQAGKIDATVDTLVSLGEVTLDAQAMVDIDVKSGGIETLRLMLPPGVTLLGLTGPSMRSHERKAGTGEGAPQTIEVAFTQAMEGQFRLEARYQHILETGATTVAVPTLRVLGAEVEQGRIAVEALSAVEVQAASADRLTTLDPADLPRQLLLRTSNPILLAYKYVRAEPRPSLRLAVERHELIGVQEAVIDEARYTTLVTRGGMAVTRARFILRNSRKQFLRLNLPEGARMWSALVDGRPEKPALAGAQGTVANEVLIKIKNATEGFVVDMVFEVPGPKLGGLGTLEAALPQPDILVTDTRWDVYVPAGLRYGTPRTSMEIASAGVPSAPEEIRARMAVSTDSNAGPLIIRVPTAGVRYSFAKLYANQSTAAPLLRMGYASGTGVTVGSVLSIFGSLLAWLGLAVWLLPATSSYRRLASILGALGLALVATMLGVFHLSATPVVITTICVLLAAASAYTASWWRTRRDAAFEI